MKYVVMILGLLILAALLKPVARMLRQALIRAFHGILAGLVSGFGVMFVAALFVEEPLMATGLGALVGIPVGVLSFLYLLWRDGRDALEDMEAAANAPAPFPPTPPAPVPPAPLAPAPEPDPEPATDKAVREAWRKALALAPQAELARLTRARKSCDLLLEGFDKGEFALDPKAIDHVHLIRERLPALVGSAVEETRTASPDYRARVLRRMVEHLLDFGTIAEARLTAATPATEDWEVLDAYLANRLRGEGAE